MANQDYATSDSLDQFYVGVGMKVKRLSFNQASSEDEYRRLHGHITSQMYNEYKQLRKRQRQLIWQGRRKLFKY